GKPILLHTVERFVVDEFVDRVIVAVAEPLLANIRQTERVRFVAGGATRQQSVIRALASASDLEPELIAVHDAVRPFFSHEVFHVALEAAREYGAAVPVIPVTDTIHIASSEMTIAQTLERNQLAAAQTPQCFRAEVLRDVLERAAAAGDDATDEAGLAARYGYQVKVVPGDAMNFKITRPEDLAYAETCLATWSKQA
ncbi:MAG TPA: 2-C-methyl-D-erythritol 4-phosphate cytidylyltransferase, partial [Thermoanaerobaculia bacterium]